MSETKRAMAADVVALASKLPRTTCRRPQKNGSVRGRIQDLYSFSVDPLVGPPASYRVHLQVLGASPAQRLAWSRKNAKSLGGFAAPASPGRESRVVVEGLALHELERVLEQLAEPPRA